MTGLLIIENERQRREHSLVEKLTEIERKGLQRHETKIEKKFDQRTPTVDVSISPVEIDLFVVQVIGIGENQFAIVDVILLRVVSVAVDQFRVVRRARLLDRFDFVGEKLLQRFQPIEFQIRSFVVLTRLENILNLIQIDVRRLQLFEYLLIFFDERHAEHRQGQSIHLHVDQFEEKIQRRIDEVLRDDRRFVGQMKQFMGDQAEEIRLDGMFEHCRRTLQGQRRLNLFLNEEMFVKKIESDLHDRNRMIRAQKIKNFVGQRQRFVVKIDVRGRQIIEEGQNRLKTIVHPTAATRQSEIEVDRLQLMLTVEATEKMADVRLHWFGQQPKHGVTHTRFQI